MLKSQEAKAARARLEQIKKRYDPVVEKLSVAAIELNALRRETASDFRPELEKLFKALFNQPSGFEAAFKNIDASAESFEERVIKIEKLAREAKMKGGAAVGGGMAIAAAATATPTAAMAIATAFGTASTGTAISALSGAAATNAALAWLGGGALVAGGGGVAAGTTFLTLAGPVGWAIGGGLAVGSGLFMRWRNGKIVKEAESLYKNISKDLPALKERCTAVQESADQTRVMLRTGQALLEKLGKAPADYHEYTDEQQEQLSELETCANTLAKLLKLTFDTPNQTAS